MRNIACAALALLSAGCSVAPVKTEAPPQACLPPAAAAPEISAETAAAPWGFSPVMRAGLAPAQPRDIPVAAAATPTTDLPKPERRSLFRPDADAYDIVAAGRGLSLHKPMYLMPYTYSPQYDGRHSEMMFQISFKQQLFGLPLYAAYSQKSFWQAYDFHESSPFRETDYNPELFYRYLPADRVRWFHLGADVGFEHESNGRGLPDSRSWNRVYAALFQAEGDHLLYWKWWYRLPVDDSRPVTDPERDDNPHIGYYYGYSELTYEQQLWNKQLARAMVRFNPVTGKGAVNLQYTIPNNAADPDFFWFVYLWQGYGEDLLNYNHSTFRLGVGVSLAR